MPLPGTVVFDYDPGKISASDGDPIDPLVDHSGNGLDLFVDRDAPAWRPGVFCGLPSYSWENDDFSWLYLDGLTSDPVSYNNLTIFVVQTRLAENYNNINRCWAHDGTAYTSFLSGITDGWDTDEVVQIVTDNHSPDLIHGDRPNPRVMTFRRDGDVFVYQNLDLLITESGSDGSGTFNGVEIFSWEVGLGRVVGVADLSESEMIEWQTHLVDIYVLCVEPGELEGPGPRIGQREDRLFL